MSLTYESVAAFAQTGGLAYFVALFLGAALYALWPRNGARFSEAARLPLNED
jgi:cytochrome c oxidase cbb3-type subunit IV